MSQQVLLSTPSDTTLVATLPASAYYNATQLVDGPSPATLIYRINSNGQIYMQINGGAIFSVGTWLVAGTNADFQVRATIVSGSLTSGTVGTWMDTTAIRSWTASTDTGFARVATTVLTIEIREKVSLAVDATCTLTLERDITT